MTDSAIILLSCAPFLVLVGMWVSRRPPRRINLLFGYRTKKSMQDQARWDFAQKYSGRLLTRSGWILFAAAGVSYLLPEITEWIQVVLALGVVIFSCLMPYWSTEKALANRFEQSE